MRTWLSNAQHSWLLVIDNADNHTMDYAEILPTGTKGNILFTTRNPQCIDTYATVGSEILDDLGLEGATELLLKAAAVTQSKDEHEAAARVVQDLGFHTLAIIQAGAYIKHRHSSFEDYSNLFKQQQHQLLHYNLKQAQSTHGSVFATFEVSAIHMQSSKDEVAINALCLLGVLSFLHPNEISESIFSRAWDEVVLGVERTDEEWSLNGVRGLSEVDLFQLPWIIKQNNKLATNRIAWRESVDLLESYSLIKVSGETTNLSFSMHPLAHLWSRVRLQLDCQRKAWRATGSIIVFSMRTPNYQTFFEKLRLHAQAYLGHPIVEYMERIPHKELCQTFIYLCWLLVQLGEDSKLAYLLQNLNKFEGWTCAPEIYSLDEQELTAISYQREGQSSEAVHLLEYVVQRRITLLKPEDTCLLESQHNLALAYGDLGQAKKAEELLECVIKIQQRLLQPDHDKLLTHQHELARAYHANGEVKRAIKLLENVVEIQATTFRPEHPYRLVSEHELARAYHANGEVKRAIKLFKNVVKIRATTLKPEERARLISEHELARAYHANGEVKRAIKLFKNVVKIRATTLRPEERARLISEHELARAYHKDGQVKNAIKLLKNIVKIQAMTLIPEHPDRLTSEHELARALFSNGEATKAAELLEKVVEASERVLEPRDPDLMGSRELLAEVYTYMKLEEEDQSSDSLHPPPSSPAKAPRRDPSPVQSKSDTEASIPSQSLRANRAHTQQGKLLDNGVDIEESELEKPRSGGSAATRESRRSEGNDSGENSAARGRRGGQKRQVSVDLTGVASKRGRRH